MTEEELVKAFREVIQGERERIQTIAPKMTPRQLSVETHTARMIFRSIHPNGDTVVDHWIEEATYASKH